MRHLPVCLPPESIIFWKFHGCGDWYFGACPRKNLLNGKPGASFYIPRLSKTISLNNISKFRRKKCLQDAELAESLIACSRWQRSTGLHRSLRCGDSPGPTDRCSNSSWSWTSQKKKTFERMSLKIVQIHQSTYLSWVYTVTHKPCSFPSLKNSCSQPSNMARPIPAVKILRATTFTREAQCGGKPACGRKWHQDFTLPANSIGWPYDVRIPLHTLWKNQPILDTKPDHLHRPCVPTCHKLQRALWPRFRIEDFSSKVKLFFSVNVLFVVEALCKLPPWITSEVVRSSLVYVQVLAWNLSPVSIRALLLTLLTWFMSERS